MPKIKNKLYNSFLIGEGMEFLDLEVLDKIINYLDNFYKEKYRDMAKALVILLFYTGCRPSEALEVTAQDIKKEDNFLVIWLKTLKKGKPRKLLISFKHRYISFLYKYANNFYPDFFIFWKFKSKYIKKNKNNNIETSKKIYYLFKKISKGIGIDIVPYYLRHNRFSLMAEKGATYEMIKHFKGAKTLASVEPYVHLSKEKLRKISRFI